ncbi:MAG: hypothetical protein HZA46_03755 [Planctomycetales bacterium]|nr:hypothetical protein [Planctomycetales bacterium]
MAIEFLCPYCSVTINVPDNAAGRTGKCPSCQQRLKVPAPATPSAVPSVPAAPSDPALASAFSFTNPEAEAAELPLAMLRRQRRGLHPAAILVPIVCIVAVAAAIGWFALRPAAKLSGTLTAESLARPDMPPAEIDKGDIDLPEDELPAILKVLEKFPARMPSALMKVEIGATRDSLQIRMQSGSDTQFYRLDPNQDVVLKRFIAEHNKEFDEPRREEVRAAVPKFLRAYIEYREALNAKENPAPYNPQQYRDAVALSGAVQGFGYHVQAAHDGTAYRCVGQDEAGRLYFLLPPGVESFALEGRKLADLLPSKFPGRIDVKVKPAKVEAVPASKSKPAEKPGKAKSKKESEEPSEPASESIDTAAPKAAPE